jgi:hypothetical protein
MDIAKNLSGKAAQANWNGGGRGDLAKSVAHQFVSQRHFVSGRPSRGSQPCIGRRTSAFLRWHGLTLCRRPIPIFVDLSIRQGEFHLGSAEHPRTWVASLEP